MYTDQDIANLVARVQQLEQQAAIQPRSGLPNLGLLSRNFLTRAFSVWGLYFVSSLLIGIAFSCLFTIIGLIAGAGFFGGIQEWARNLSGNLPLP